MTSIVTLGEIKVIQGRQRIINSILTTDQCSGSEQWFWKWWQLCSSFSAWASSRPESRLPADTARQPTCAATEVNILWIVDRELVDVLQSVVESSSLLSTFVQTLLLRMRSLLSSALRATSLMSAMTEYMQYEFYSFLGHQFNKKTFSISLH